MTLSLTHWLVDNIYVAYVHMSTLKMQTPESDCQVYSRPQGQNGLNTV